MAYGIPCAPCLTREYGLSYFAPVRKRTTASSLGERILSLRTDLGLSVRDVAKRGGVSHSIVHGLERGWQQSTSVERLNRIAKGLGVTLAVLIGVEEGDRIAS
ncbi:helix-turn-helix domain-containing protein [Vulgatibacter sp.]|uniref:helix-turn-helix domain-containing protein n=1 Tax=Vulgatibacter sp. TaxID=1971226 RepID=UPI003563BEF0